MHISALYRVVSWIGRGVLVSIAFMIFCTRSLGCLFFVKLVRLMGDHGCMMYLLSSMRKGQGGWNDVLLRSARRCGVAGGLV